MSGINERIRALCAAFDRTESPEILCEIRELEFQKRTAGVIAGREQRERAARKVEEKQQRAAAHNSEAWRAAIDERIKFWFDHYFDGLGKQAPGGSDWVCVARAGRDAVTPNFRGTFNAHKTYAHFDVIEYDGSSFIARRDDPGVPGISDGWQPLSRAGRRGPAGATGETGPRGRKGERGARGEDGSEITGWHLERATFRAFPVYADGRMGPELNLRGLFEEFVAQAGHAAE